MDFGPVFLASPNAYLVLRADYFITAANQSFLQLMGRSPESVIGHSILDAFPPNPQSDTNTGQTTIRNAVDRVVATRQPVTLTDFEYSIADFSGDRTRFHERLWNCALVPIVGADQVLHVLIATHDISAQHFSHLKLGRRADPPA